MKQPTKLEIEAAHKRIIPYLHETPVWQSAHFNSEFNATLYFKCENFQKTGSFKARGATNAVLTLTDAEKQKGVCTHSSGNHGAALAWAAKSIGAKCYVVVPENAPSVKLRAMRGYGAEITLCKPTLEARESGLKAIQEETGATFIPPYNHINVIEGQASAAKELINTVPDLDYLITPVGGGGLLSGSALSAHYFSSKTIVLGAEPVAADDAKRSLMAGKLIPQTGTQTVADGLRTSLGMLTFPIIQQHVQDILLATEDEIIYAMRDTWERMKMIIEPSCAVPLAAMRAQRSFFSGKKVGIIITGGNVDLSHLPFE